MYVSIAVEYINYTCLISLCVSNACHPACRVDSLIVCATTWSKFAKFIEGINIFILDNDNMTILNIIILNLFNLKSTLRRL